VDGLAVGFYEYKIVAIDGTAWGEIEDTVQVEVGLVPGTPVFITTSQTLTFLNMTVRWEAATGADSYDVYIDDVFIDSTGDTEKFVEFTGNGTYSIYLVAINTFGESPTSNQLIVTVEISSEATNDTDTTDTRFDPFSDDPLRNVSGYSSLVFFSLILGTIALFLWKSKRQMSRFIHR
jgi:hypothetical protein